jgi:hypothetical protein
MMMGKLGNSLATCSKRGEVKPSEEPRQLTGMPSSAALRHIAKGSLPGDRVVGPRRIPSAPSLTQRAKVSGASGLSVSTITTALKRPGKRCTHSMM